MWVFNVFLYLMFFGNNPAYQSMVQRGSACYFYYGQTAPSAPQPACFYDPSNTNPFIPY